MDDRSKICPKCQDDYSQEVQICVDCGAPLVTYEEFAKRFDPLEPSDELIVVGASPGGAIKDIARLLNDAGIRTFVQLAQVDPHGGMQRSQFIVAVEPVSEDESRGIVEAYWRSLSPDEHDADLVNKGGDEHCPACNGPIKDNMEECPDCGIMFG